MSITGILSTAVTGLMVNQAALRSTGSNIANVNTPDYKREVVRQESLVVSGGYNGVEIGAVERIVARYLEAASLGANAHTAQAETESKFLDRLQVVLGSPGGNSNLGAKFNQVFADLAELSLSPSDQSIRGASLASISDFVDDISRIHEVIQSLRAEANKEIETQVGVANQLLRSIHEMNPTIIRLRTLGENSAGLENQRDRAISELTDILDVQVARRDDGSVFISTASGTSLIDATLRELDYSASGIVTSESRFVPIQIYRTDPLTGERTGTSRDFNGDIGSGKLRGLIKIRDQDMPNLSFSLGNLARTFINEVNAVHNSYSAVPAPNIMSGRNIGLDQTHAHGFTGKATFAITDKDNQLVQKTTIDFDAIGLVSIVTVSNLINAGLGGAGTVSYTNGVLSFEATDPSHGVVIIDDQAAPAKRGGRGFSHYFGLNDLLEAAVETNFATGIRTAEPVAAGAGEQVTFEIRDSVGRLLGQQTISPSNKTLSVIVDELNNGGNLGKFYDFSLDVDSQLLATPKSGFNEPHLSVLSDTTNLSGTGLTFSQLFGLGDRYLADASKNIKIRSDIEAQPQNLALAAFDQTALIGETALSRGDQSGALALRALETYATSFSKAGELDAAVMSLGQYVSAVLSSAGNQAMLARQRAEDSIALKAETDARLGDISGVNLDEELANMIVLQNAYNASARLIKISQELFDDILSI